MAAAINLLAPQTPMMFMGEEWGSEQPFLFFSDVDPALAENIRQSRIREFSESAPAGTLDIPDPMAEESFLRSKLDWHERDRPERAEYLAFYRRLLEIRRTEIVPLLVGVGGHSGSFGQI